MKVFNQIKVSLAIGMISCFLVPMAHSMVLPISPQREATAFHVTPAVSKSVASTSPVYFGAVSANSASSQWRLVYSGAWFPCWLQWLLLKGPNHDSSAYMKKNGNHWEVWSQHWN